MRFEFSGFVNDFKGVTAGKGDVIPVTDENAEILQELQGMGLGRTVAPETPLSSVEKTDEEDGEEQDLVDVDLTDSVDELDLNKRFIQALKDAKLETIESLIDADLKSVPGLSDQAIAKIEAALEELTAGEDA